MGTPDDGLRLVLISLNEVKQVAVLAAAEEFAPQLLSMGVVKGKEQLEALLEMAAVDRYVVTYGEPFATTFRSSPFEHTPRQIIEGLEKGFREADELLSRQKRGEALSEEEQARLRFVPRSWMVWSSALSSAEGIARVRAWFAEKKSAEATKSKEGPSQKTESQKEGGGPGRPASSVPLAGNPASLTEGG